jgi:hypothetical protein
MEPVRSRVPRSTEPPPPRPLKIPGQRDKRVARLCLAAGALFSYSPVCGGISGVAYILSCT